MLTSLLRQLGHLKPLAGQLGPLVAHRGLCCGSLLLLLPGHCPGALGRLGRLGRTFWPPLTGPTAAAVPARCSVDPVLAAHTAAQHVEGLNRSAPASAPLYILSKRCRTQLAGLANGIRCSCILIDSRDPSAR